MTIEIKEDNLKHGLLGLVIAVVEIITDTLKLQAVKRMDSGRLSEEEIERLGTALMKLDETIEKIKGENEISEAVQNIKDGLDGVVDAIVSQEAMVIEGN